MYIQFKEEIAGSGEDALCRWGGSCSCCVSIWIKMKKGLSVTDE